MDENKNELPKIGLLQQGLPKKLLIYGIISSVVALSIAYSMEWIKFDLNDKFSFLFWIFSFFFLIIGVIAGVIFGDKNVRTVFLRNATKKNFGYVHYVSRGRYVFTKIRNLDNDFIMDKSGQIFTINKGKIYKQKDGSQSYDITNEHISMTGGIPQIFIDIDTMEPLSFHVDENAEKFNPERIGANVKTMVAVETAKGLLGNKVAALIGIISIIAAAGAAYFSYDTNQFIHEKMEPFINDAGPSISYIKQIQQQTHSQGGEVQIGDARIKT
jgi:hypothetical protein